MTELQPASLQPKDANRQLRRRLRLGEVLVNAGLVQKQDIDAALEQQKKQTGKRLGEVLVDMEIVDEVVIAETLAGKLGLPFVNLDDIEVESSAVAEVPFRVVRQHGVLPVRVDAKSLTVAMGDPLSIEALDALRFTCQKQIVEVVASPSQIREYVDHFEASQGSNEDFEDFLRGISAQKPGKPSPDTSDSDDGAVVKLVNRVIVDAVREGASDIHIEPHGQKEDLLIRFRVDGRCHDYRRIPSEYRNQLVARIKIMSRLNIAERRKPQDGKIHFKLGNTQIELRVVTLPTAGDNEDVVMRLLTGTGVMSMSRIDLSQKNYNSLEKLIRSPYGIILAVGPTGSGKTTTLHSILSEINSKERKIWTVEDPVEITQMGLRQLQVHPQIGLTFAAAMRSFLRADPDVIMVGEMRDYETAQIAVEASLTGHLVFSTLHTNTASETITRLVDMGIEAFSFSDALLGVISQRLTRRLCPKCKIEYEAGSVEIEELSGHFDSYVTDQLISSDGLRLFRAEGCSYCSRTGYYGRVALHELLQSNDDIRDAIQHKSTAAEVQALAEKSGMVTMLQDGIAKCLEGKTDLGQVLAVCNR
ncbi:MAG: pilus assembly protein PilB [Acidiferrobacteraceae bacterium]|nr:pilus assembly protein PilB [Acidiferrobacteraceae bacterium]